MTFFKNQASFKINSQNKRLWLQSQTQCILTLINSEFKQMVKKLVKGEVAVTNSDLRVDWSTVK